MLIACGDSHTTTYGAFGALGFGIGTSEVEHVLATQTLRYKRMKTMRVNIGGETAPGVTAKDIIMKVVQVVGAGGANGYAVEFAGSAIRGLDIAGRMTVCNMAVELGARAALIAVDEITEAALTGHPIPVSLPLKVKAGSAIPKPYLMKSLLFQGPISNL